MPKKDDKKAYKGFRGTIRAALLHHPDKFSKEACKEKGKKGGKMCPYAIFTAQKEKGDKAHYKELPHTTKGTPEKKAKYKDKKKDEVYSFAEFLKKKELCECEGGKMCAKCKERKKKKGMT